jgi:uncharacterized membrane protein YfcA
MTEPLLHDGIYFLLTFVLATLFAMGGVGSAIALVPTFSMLGMPLNLAKATGLFVNSASTITASVMNFRRGVLDVRFTLPLVIAVVIATPVGAWLSRYVPVHIVEWALAGFLLVSAGLLIITRREAKVSQACEGEGVVGKTSAIPCSFHTDVGILAEHGGTVLQGPDYGSPKTGCLSYCPRLDQGDQRIYRGPQ